MKFIAKNIRSRTHFPLVFIVDRGTCETKENSAGKRLLNITHHVAECRTMAFIYDKHNTLIIDKFYIFAIHVVVILDIAHFLDRRNNKRIGRIGTLQLGYQYIRIFCSLHRFIIIGKIAIFQ